MTEKLNINNKNIIDLCRIKTYIISQYIENASQILYENNSYKEIEWDVEKKQDNIKLTTNYKNLKIIYYIFYDKVNNWDFINEENVYPEPIIILRGERVQDNKLINKHNIFNFKQTLIHYPTNMSGNGVKSIMLIDKDLFIMKKKCYISESNNKLNTKSIQSNDLQFKLFYHPVYCKDNDIYGFEFHISSISSIIEKKDRFRVI